MTIHIHTLLRSVLLGVYLALFVGFLTANIRSRRKNLYYPHRWKNIHLDVLSYAFWPITFSMGVLVPATMAWLKARRARSISKALDAVLLAWAEADTQYCNTIRDLNAQIANSKAKTTTEVMSALVPWLEHSSACPSRTMYSTPAACDCGLAATFAKLRGGQ